jgi:hypothetical protein
MARVLVVDDEENIRQTFAVVFNPPPIVWQLAFTHRVDRKIIEGVFPNPRRSRQALRNHPRQAHADHEHSMARAGDTGGNC